MTEFADRAARPERDSAADLALVGEIAALLDARRFLDTLDAALRRLQEYSRADAGELFLAAPTGEEVFLVSHQGRDIAAFCQRERFRVGEGLPGIALRKAAPVLTSSLQSEPDFIRTRVKRLDYRSAVCVPIGCADAVAGCLLLAWKEVEPDLERAVRLMEMAARPIGTAVEAAHARIRIDEIRRHRPRPDVTRCDGVRAVPASHADSVPAPADEAGWLAPAAGLAVRSAANEGGRAEGERCPALWTARIQVHGGRSGWPRPCTQAGCLAKARYCIPLVAGQGVWGIATVAFGRDAPVPLTRHLPVALWLTEDIAPEAAARRDRAMLERWEPEPRLQIHCFGGFRVVVDGRAIERDGFGRQKARELLALLVVGSGRPRGGDALAQALWPGADPAHARNRFHVTLSGLRSVIEPSDGVRWTHIRRVGRAYYLDPRSPVRVDLWHLEELLRRARAAVAAGRPAGEIAGLIEAAIGLYRGDAFDDEFTGTWCADASRRCRQELLRTLRSVARMACRSGAFDGVATALARAQEAGLIPTHFRERKFAPTKPTGRPAQAAASTS